MKKITLFTLVLSLSFSVFGQRNEKAEYWNTWHYQPKDGMTQKFEAAAAAKTKMFNASPNNLIVTYKIMTGDNAGVYERIMPFQTSADYDKDKSKELNYWSTNVSKYCTPKGGQQIWQRLKWADVNVSEEANPSKHLMKTVFIVKQDQLDHFYRFIERIGKVQGKFNKDISSITLRLHSGGNRNLFVRYVGFEKHEREPSDIENTWEEEYNEMFGWNSWTNDIEMFDQSLEMWGRQNEKLRLVESMLPSTN
ncbi:MAG: hypothetical protein ACPH57_08445 [Flavobacteriaceae bacterium]